MLSFEIPGIPLDVMIAQQQLAEQITQINQPQVQQPAQPIQQGQVSQQQSAWV